VGELPRHLVKQLKHVLIQHTAVYGWQLRFKGQPVWENPHPADCI